MKLKPLFWMVLVLFLIGYTGCSSDSSSPEPSSLSFATFNAGLAQGYVPYYSARLPQVIAAVSDANADIICLQEVWKDEDVAAVVDAAKELFPFSYWEQTEQETGAVCTGGEETEILDCADTYCGEVNPDNLADCVLANCTNEFLSLSADCQSCMVSNLGKTLEEIGENCATGATPAGLWSNDGRNGVLILSRLPFTLTESKMLDAYLVRRIVLHVRVEDEQSGSVDVYGTHLTADLGNAPPYAGEAESWLEEQGLQIDALLVWISETAGENNSVVLMGDMNCGPEIYGIQAEAPENYERFQADRWNAPYAGGNAPLCTFCSDNPLISNNDSDVLIDHIFFKNGSNGYSTLAERIFDGRFALSTENGPMDLPLSDHYGVRVEITTP
jgi:endonuclease/exonuclease/phosphatase family metal-dependent hydrolase